MNQPTRLAKAILKLIQIQNQVWWNHTTNGETPNTTYEMEYQQAVLSYRTLISEGPKVNWHREWRVAIRNAKQILPDLSPKVINTVLMDIREAQTKTLICRELGESSKVPSSSPRPSRFSLHLYSIAKRKTGRNRSRS